ncbi:MAG: NrsF family protein [Pseudomonadota bacterium]
MKTEDLIHRLAADLPEAGLRGARPGHGVGLDGAAVLALVLTLPLCLALHGLRAGGTAADVVGLLVWLAAGAGALWSAHRLARPEPAPMIALCGPLGLLLAVLGGLAVLGLREGVTVFRADHLAHCAEVIGLLAILPFLGLTRAMRRGAPASPRAAGATIGLIAGAIAALAYTLSCPIDDAVAALSAHAFSVLLVTGLGAVLGPSLFSW